MQPVQGQEGGPALAAALEELHSLLGLFPARHDHMLKGPTQRGLQGPVQLWRHLELGGHRADDAGELLGLEHRAHAAGVASSLVAEALQQVEAGQQPVRGPLRLLPGRLRRLLLLAQLGQLLLQGRHLRPPGLDGGLRLLESGLALVQLCLELLLLALDSVQGLFVLGSFLLQGVALLRQLLQAAAPVPGLFLDAPQPLLGLLQLSDQGVALLLALIQSALQGPHRVLPLLVLGLGCHYAGPELRHPGGHRLLLELKLGPLPLQLLLAGLELPVTFLGHGQFAAHLLRGLVLPAAGPVQLVEPLSQGDLGLP